jgi:hypothetical protein
MTINTTDLTLFQRETSPGSGSYTTIAQVIDIKPPEKKRKKLEQPIHDQSTPVVKYGGYESMMCEIELAFDNGLAAHQQLYTDQDAKTERSYKIVYPDAGTREDKFSATIESIAPGSQNAEGETQKATIVFGLSAAPVITW